jgi:hypothetical protein
VQALAAAWQRDLEEFYGAFNPDRDTIALRPDNEARTPEGYADLRRRLCHLLDKANFEQLDDMSVRRAVRLANTHGLRIQLDPSRIEELLVFARGRGTVHRVRRSVRSGMKRQTVVLSVYRRLVVIARLKGDPHVLIKMFKDIPERDVEVLLPHAEVTMNWLDRALMLGGGAGVVGSTATQIMKIGLLAISRLLWVLTMGLAMLLWRTFSGYQKARHKRDWQRTQHLYYHNMSNNAAALHMLISMTKQEEIKEAALAYMLCLLGDTPPAGAEELKTRAEKYLYEKFGAEVDFDVEDAIEKLERLGLWADRSELRVVSMEEAMVLLESASRPAARLRLHPGARWEGRGAVLDALGESA